MKKAKPRTFKNPLILQEMLALRLQGWTLKDLAFKYGCDYTSIRKACLKMHIPHEIPLKQKPHIKFKAVQIDWNNERIATGKSYKEYLKERNEKCSLLKL